MNINQGTLSSECDCLVDKILKSIHHIIAIFCPSTFASTVSPIINILTFIFPGHLNILYSDDDICNIIVVCQYASVWPSNEFHIDC